MHQNILCSGAFFIPNFRRWGHCTGEMAIKSKKERGKQ